MISYLIQFNCTWEHINLFNYQIIYILYSATKRKTNNYGEATISKWIFNFSGMVFANSDKRRFNNLTITDCWALFGWRYSSTSNIYFARAERILNSYMCYVCSRFVLSVKAYGLSMLRLISPLLLAQSSMYLLQHLQTSRA